MTSISVTEGIEFSLDPIPGKRLRDAAERLQAQLKPKLPLLTERAGKFKLSNVVGTIDIGGGVLIEVSPKVPATTDWVTAVVSLLTGGEDIEVAGDRRAGASNIHNKLLDALSRVYLRRIQKAYRQDGPIVLLERISRTLPYLHGKLDVTRWARSAMWQPHLFPVSRTELAQDNPFTRCLTCVAEKLAHVSSDLAVRNSLRALSRDLSAGLSYVHNGLPIVTRQALPEQWSAYKPAWALATAILTKSSLLGVNGNLSGVGLAIEAWPLLESLLEQSLSAVQRIGKTRGQDFTYRMQGSISLLRASGPAPQRPFAPQPDGRLFKDGQLIATFEAKYTEFDGKVPFREHIYQCLSTAAACGSPTAVLVYPEAFSPLVWNVDGFQGRPLRLVAVGLDLFRWPPPLHPMTRGETLWDLLQLGVTASAGHAQPVTA